MNNIIKRVFKNGVMVSESESEFDYTPNAADLDLVDIECECGSGFEMPWDAAKMFLHDCHCGECGQKGKLTMKEKKKEPEHVKPNKY